MIPQVVHDDDVDDELSNQHGHEDEGIAIVGFVVDVVVQDFSL